MRLTRNDHQLGGFISQVKLTMDFHPQASQQVNKFIQFLVLHGLRAGQGTVFIRFRLELSKTFGSNCAMRTHTWPFSGVDVALPASFENVRC